MNNKEGIDKLIQEVMEDVLQERWVNITPVPKAVDVFQSPPPEADDAKIDALAKTTPAINVLDSGDFEAALRNSFTDPLARTARAVLNKGDKIDRKDRVDLAKGLVKVDDVDDENKKDMISNLLGKGEIDPTLATQKRSPADSVSIVQQQLENIGADPGNASANLGSFPEGLGSAADVFFDGKDTLEARCEHLSEISAVLLEGDRDTIVNKFGGDVKQFLAASLFMDYVSTIGNGIDSGAGAYNFEVMCALMAGGRVTGKASGPAGGMGAADFVTNTGAKGSSKYLESVTSGKATQAPGGFEEDTVYLYMIAHKMKTETGTAISTGGTADPLELLTINLYLLRVAKVGDKFYAWPRGETTPKDITPPKDSSGAYTALLNLGGANLMKSPLPIRLAKARTAGGTTTVLKKQLSATLNRKQDDISKAFRYMREYFNELSIASNKAQAYAVKGENVDGEAALESMDVADEKFGKLVAIISPKGSRGKAAGVKGARKKRRIKENNKKTLDKLIEEVILKSMMED